MLLRSDRIAARTDSITAKRPVHSGPAWTQPICQGFALREALASGDPKGPAYRSGLANGLRRLAALKLAGGDAAGASADARSAVGLYEALPSRSGLLRFGRGCSRATLSDAAGCDGFGHSDAEVPELADLRQPVATGYRNLLDYRRDPALVPLWGRDDFRVLMRELAFPANPFA